jgi:hypothetical protein
VAKFKALSRHLAGGTEENNNKPQDSQCVSWNSNQAPPKYKDKGIITSAIEFKDPIHLGIILI